jgi:hypothetical protein
LAVWMGECESMKVSYAVAPEGLWSMQSQRSVVNGRTELGQTSVLARWAALGEETRLPAAFERQELQDVQSTGKPERFGSLP